MEEQSKPAPPPTSQMDIEQHLGHPRVVEVFTMRVHLPEWWWGAPGGRGLCYTHLSPKKVGWGRAHQVAESFTTPTYRPGRWRGTPGGRGFCDTRLSPIKMVGRHQVAEAFTTPTSHPGRCGAPPRCQRPLLHTFIAQEGGGAPPGGRGIDYTHLSPRKVFGRHQGAESFTTPHFSPRKVMGRPQVAEAFITQVSYPEKVVGRPPGGRGLYYTYLIAQKR